MCQGVSCEVGKHGDEIMVWFGDPDVTTKELDSHSRIREFHKLPEVTRNGWRRTPLEFYFHNEPESADRMELHFDDGRPDWWDSDVDATVRQHVQAELNRRDLKHKKNGIWPGYPVFIGSDVKVPWKGVDILDARAATSFSAPALTQCGYLDARAATSFSAPALTTVSGSLYASDATSFSAPALTTVSGSLYARAATSFSAPALTQCGSLDARAATSFSAPALTQCGYLDASAATSFSAPALTTVSGSLDARAAVKKKVELVMKKNNKKSK